jgi:endonuclease III-like uncharacterized protein
MSDLRDDLTEIQGVGEATADSILEVLAEHDTGTDSEVREAVLETWDYYQDGQYSYAGKYLERAVNHLQD